MIKLKKLDREIIFKVSLKDQKKYQQFLNLKILLKYFNRLAIDLTE